MEEFLTSPFFYNFLVPFLGTLFIIFVKIVSKNDSDLRKIKREDFAVGIDLAVVSITYYAVETAKTLSISAKNNVENIFHTVSMNVWIILILFISLWIISTFIRFWGWDEEKNLRYFWGIIIPNIYGTLCLIFVVMLIGG
ncbi:hypothetical protein [Lysinibacillus sp. G4S2]|uniref:hypothetical protein n=1 Tax=Lysinibacillus sp. G4S2 TaxID=3055859 RepID=UPI0025A2DE69|nr:hypothetical protein [Lysinibacillus sp. G4S2]MDM5249629.1 hypothetical protein [Lysinibacillus sp. G4S2]